MIGPAPVNNTATSLMLLLTAALGTYAVWDGVDVRVVLFWAILGLMNGISGLAMFIDASMKGDALRMLFSTGSAYVIGLGAVCVCIVPIAMLCPIYYAYKLYTDAQEATSSSFTMSGDRGRESYGAINRPQANFQVFQGGGQRLGDL